MRVVHSERRKMGSPISIRLDDDVREELEAQAQARGVGLATLLRDVATAAARNARKSRIRQASAAIGDRVANTAEARSLYDKVGTPTTDAG
jgi:hypothetical protein